MGTHDHAAAQGRMTLGTLDQRGAAQGHALVDGAVVADLGHLANDHAHAVVDEDAPAKGGARVDLDARQPARDVRDESPQPLQAGKPARMRPAVHHQRVQAGVAGEHLERRLGSRIAFQDAGDVFTQAGEHDGWLRLGRELLAV
jgi:hypothetical protein